MKGLVIVKYLLPIILLFLFTAGCGKRERKTELRDLSGVDSILREGDLVFRCGRGITSHAVLTADKGGIYSHVGIVVRVGNEGSKRSEGHGVSEGGEWKIVHIVPGEPASDGTKDVIKTEGLDLFFAPDRASRGAVMRINSPEAAAGAAKEVERLASTGLVFDHNYNLADTTRMYCTELVYNVFLRAGFDISEGRRTRIDAPGFSGDYILPTDISRGADMELVYEF